MDFSYYYYMPEGPDNLTWEPTHLNFGCYLLLIVLRVSLSSGEKYLRLMACIKLLYALLFVISNQIKMPVLTFLPINFNTSPKTDLFVKNNILIIKLFIYYY